MSSTGGIPSLLEQVQGCAASAAAAKVEAERPPWPVNPFPRGMKDGSATQKIITALEAAYPRWLECWQLMQITGRSRGAIAWGMRYLAEHGLVRSVQSARHPQYLRYQAMKSTRERGNDRHQSRG